MKPAPDNDFIVLTADEISAEALRGFLDLGLRTIKSHSIGLVLCFTAYEYAESGMNTTYTEEYECDTDKNEG